MSDDISKVVPPVHAVTFVPSFSEAARRLGMAQAQGNRPAIAHWQGIVDAHEAAAKAALRLESATIPAEVDAPGIDTANHAGVRVRGYTVEQYATLARQLAKSERDCAELRALLTAQNAAIARTDDLARQLAEAKADNERLRAEVDDWNVNGPALVQQLELSKQREAHFTTQMLEARNAQQQAESQLAEATRRLGEVEAYRDATFDGYAVYDALDDRAKSRTSADNVADVLDALNRVARLASDSATGEGEGHD